MAIDYDQSLYAKRRNAETRAAIDAVNAEAKRIGLEDADPEWGSQATLREKMDYLDRWKRERGME